MSKEQNKKDNLYYVEIRLVKDYLSWHWEIVNRSRVLYNYHCVDFCKAVIKKHNGVQMIGYLSKKYNAGRHDRFFMASNVDFKLFKNNYERFKEMSTQGETGFFKGVILRKSEFEEFKSLVYNLNKIPEEIKLYHASKAAQKQADRLAERLYSRESYLKSLKTEIENITVEYEKLKKEAEEKRRKWKEKIQQINSNTTKDTTENTTKNTTENTTE